MAVRGYVLIEADVGKAKSVGEAVQALQHADASVVSVDTVTGPFDVIVQLQAEDLDRLGNQTRRCCQVVELSLPLITGEEGGAGVITLHAEASCRCASSVASLR